MAQNAPTQQDPTPAPEPQPQPQPAPGPTPEPQQDAREDPAAPDVRVAGGNQESRNSTPEGTEVPDALGNTPERQPSNRLADRTNVKDFGDGVTAAVTDDKDPGPFGMALPQAGELMGGNIGVVLEPPPSEQYVNRPLTKERAAMLTPIYQKLAALVNRPPSEWGLIGPGETIRGHMLLLDLNSGKKVRGMDGHRVGQGEIYANLRNFPEALASGDTIEQVLGTGGS